MKWKALSFTKKWEVQYMNIKINMLVSIRILRIMV